jgi:hypothetical protein
MLQCSARSWRSQLCGYWNINKVLAWPMFVQVAQALPAMQESVSVVGYPTGGDNVCVTKGVVSRVDRQQVR